MEKLPQRSMACVDCCIYGVEIVQVQQVQRRRLLTVTRTRSQRQTPQHLVLLILFATLISTIQYAQSYSTGAGSCAAGKAPVGGYHLEPNDPVTGDKRTVLSGALSEGFVSVLINNNADNPLIESTPYILQTKTEYTITVVTTQDPGYKGILIRFGNIDNTINVIEDIDLEPDSKLLQFSEVCSTEDNAVGITHLDNSEKLSVSAGMYFRQPGTIYLDISIVGVNDAVASLYGHTPFILQVEGDAVTDVPTGVPTKAPITVLPPGSTASPSTTPTLNDFLIDTNSPTYTTSKPVVTSPSNSLLFNTTSNALSTSMSDYYFLAQMATLTVIAALSAI